MKRKIAIVGLNYFPEESAIGLYSTEMCEYLNRDFQVEVITGYPYYPEWKIRDEYQDKKGVLIEGKNNVKIQRVKQYTPKNLNPIKRLYHYYDFYKKALKIIEKNKYDMVMVILPNIFLLNMGIKLKEKKKVETIWAHVQDFEIDAGLETIKGIEKIPFLKSSLYSMEKKLFSKFDVVSSISEGMVNILKDKGVKEENRYFLPNWSDISKLYSLKESKYREELNISRDDFVVMYSGNIGGKQDWNTVIEGIKEIKNEKIKFVIAGDGNKKDFVEKNLRGLDNVKILPLQSKERLNEFLNLGDLHLIPQKPDAKDSFMPSKLLGIMSVEKPVLILANRKSNLYEVISKEKIGYTLNENEYQEFSATIEMIFQDETRINKGKNGRKYLLNNYIYENIMEKLIVEIKGRIEK